MQQDGLVVLVNRRQELERTGARGYAKRNYFYSGVIREIELGLFVIFIL